MNERDSFIESNMGLVHACGRKFIGKGIEYEDLCSAGCIGLIKAVDSFDRERGVCFSTYAVPVILGEMRRLFRDGGSVKVSRGLKELSLKATRLQETLSRELGRDATVGEIALRMDISPEEVAEALAAARPVLSLTAYSEEGEEQIDIKVADEAPRLENNLDLKAALKSIDIRDQKLIYLRYFDLKTQKETALALGMTQVQVSRREKAILKNLKEKLK